MEISLDGLRQDSCSHELCLGDRDVMHMDRAVFTGFNADSATSYNFEAGMTCSTEER